MPGLGAEFQGAGYPGILKFILCVSVRQVPLGHGTWSRAPSCLGIRAVSLCKILGTSFLSEMALPT